MSPTPHAGMKGGRKQSASFTPGPWMVEKGFFDILSIRQVVSPRGGSGSVATVFGSRDTHQEIRPGVTQHERVAVPNAEANACLIASAPDLYAALKLVSAHIGFTRNTEFVREAMVAALRKVEGSDV